MSSLCSSVAPAHQILRGTVRGVSGATLGRPNNEGEMNGAVECAADFREATQQPHRMTGAEAALVLGLLTTVLIWLPGRPWRYEQFTLPKDMAFGVLGVVSAIGVAFRGARAWDRWVDIPFILALGWGGLLALAAPVDPDAAWRELGSLAAGTAVLLLARHVRTEGGGERSYAVFVLLLAVVSGAVLLEAYGGIAFFSEPGRRPGAMLGNRNNVARFTCLCLPVLWRQLVLCNRTVPRLVYAGITFLAAAVIAISRSRGAWLIGGVLVAALPLASLLFLSGRSTARRVRSDTRLWVAMAVTGGALVPMLPNRLAWGPDDFASSAIRVLDYESGTGLGRVIQAQTSLRMIRGAPFRGVGPGHWSIFYAAYARPGDPSYTPLEIYPAPTIPRSDVLSLTAEFGIPALLAASLALVGVLRRGWESVRSGDLATMLSGVVAMGVAAAVALFGFIDPVLRVSPLLAVVTVLLGLSLSPAKRQDRQPGDRGKYPLAQRLAVAACGTCSLWFAAGACRDLVAYQIIRSAHSLGDLHRAVEVAPRNFEARMLIANELIVGGRCDLAEQHLLYASRLQPFSGALERFREECALSFSFP